MEAIDKNRRVKIGRQSTGEAFNRWRCKLGEKQMAQSIRPPLRNLATHKIHTSAAPDDGHYLPVEKILEHGCGVKSPSIRTSWPQRTHTMATIVSNFFFRLMIIPIDVAVGDWLAAGPMAESCFFEGDNVTPLIRLADTTVPDLVMMMTSPETPQNHRMGPWPVCSTCSNIDNTFLRLYSSRTFLRLSRVPDNLLICSLVARKKKTRKFFKREKSFAYYPLESQVALICIRSFAYEINDQHHLTSRVATLCAITEANSIVTRFINSLIHLQGKCAANSYRSLSDT